MPIRQREGRCATGEMRYVWFWFTQVPDAGFLFE